MIFSADRLISNKKPVLRWLSDHRLHIYLWSIFILWEVVIVGFGFGSFGKFSNYAIHYLANIIIFYVHARVLELSFKDPATAFWKTPVFVLLEIIIYVAFVFYLDRFLFRYTTILEGRPMYTGYAAVIRLAWRGLYFMFFGTAYWLLIRFLKERKEKEQVDQQLFKMLLDKEKMDKELAQAKMAFLKAQINPHLLFNTLEFMHQKMRIHAPDDAKAMIYLSEMMRYAASIDHNDEYIQVGEEIVQCENLIILQRMVHHGLYFDFAYAPDVQDIKFIPLVLMTVLENMFKHGDLYSTDHRASLNIYMDEEYFNIESVNLSNAVPHHPGLKSGLQNIKARLDNAYHENASILYGLNEEGLFKLHIRVSKKAIEKSEAHFYPFSVVSDVE